MPAVDAFRSSCSTGSAGTTSDWSSVYAQPPSASTARIAFGCTLVGPWSVTGSRYRLPGGRSCAVKQRGRPSLVDGDGLDADLVDRAVLPVRRRTPDLVHDVHARGDAPEDGVV